MLIGSVALLARGASKSKIWLKKSICAYQRTRYRQVKNSQEFKIKTW